MTVILTVHDEVLTEAPGYFHEYLSTPPVTSLAWTLDLPLSSGEFGAYHHKNNRSLHAHDWCVLLFVYTQNGWGSGCMKTRSNIMLDDQIKRILSEIAKQQGDSLSDQINRRLSASLTLEERIGEKPEWMKHMEPYIATHFANMEIPLPPELQIIQDQLDNADSAISQILRVKDYLREKFNEVAKNI